MENTLTRRDFLRLLGVAGTALAVNTVVKNLGEIPETDTPEMVETNSARFHIISEIHSNRSSYAEELLRRGVVPTAHFVESVNRQGAEEFQNNQSASTILTLENTSREGVPYGPVLDAATLVFFGKNSVDVAFEGIKIIDGLTVVGTAMSAGQELASGLGMMKIEEALSDANPEDILVKFRNILMVRKLHLLADHYAQAVGQKPDISLALGRDHVGGVVKLLKQRPDQVLDLFNEFSDEILLRIIAENGGLEAFCRLLIISVKEVFVDKLDSKSFVVDEDLRDYLIRRFDI